MKVVSNIKCIKPGLNALEIDNKVTPYVIVKEWNGEFYRPNWSEEVKYSTFEALLMGILARTDQPIVKNDDYNMVLTKMLA